MSKNTQQEKILRLMCARRQQEWWRPPDFMKEELGELFVGYEASARLSDLAHDFPAMIETRLRGNHKERRIRWETKDQWAFLLPPAIRDIINRSLPPAFKNKEAVPDLFSI